MDDRKKARIVYVSPKNSKTLIELDDIINIADGQLISRLVNIFNT